jgi:hypothetical protein
MSEEQEGQLNLRLFAWSELLCGVPEANFAAIDQLFPHGERIGARPEGCILSGPQLTEPDDPAPATGERRLTPTLRGLEEPDLASQSQQHLIDV